MANHSTKSITIYQKTYQLPVLEGNSFQQIQSQIKQRQQVIKNQKRIVVKKQQIQKKSLFGLMSNTETIDVKTTQDLSFEDKFHELERLVNDYNQLISFLSEHKQVYLEFFAQLTSDLKQVVREKLQQAQQQESKRLTLLKDETDRELITILEGQKEQILGNVWLFGKAFLLMLKKIGLISEGIEKITTDQDAQRQLLIVMVEKLGKYKKVYALQREITQSGKEAEKLAETAVNLEQYLQPFIGSFQGLINQVCEQDSTLNGTVNEIQSLVEDIMSSNTGSFMSARADDLSKNMLDFLVTNEQKKERLVMAVEDAQRQGIDWSWQQIDIKDCGDLTQAISALQAHIDGKLGEYSQEIEITPRSPLAPDFKKTLLQKGGNQQGESQEEVFDLGNGVKLEMVYIPAGGFMMGSHEDEDEQPIHKVTFAQGFYMGKYPITQAQYQAVMGNNPSYFSNAKNAPLSKGGWGDFPVENVSWDMAQQFCQQLSRKLGKQFTLPSEAQWEYACRAGTTTPFYFGETLSDELANYNANYTYGNGKKGKYRRQQTTPVGSFPPNGFGLYDMHGNVWEWCADNWHSNYENAPTDGSVWTDKSSSRYVLRGGSWDNTPIYCRSARRDDLVRDNYNNEIGFRIVSYVGRTS